MEGVAVQRGRPSRLRNGNCPHMCRQVRPRTCLAVDDSNCSSVHSGRAAEGVVRDTVHVLGMASAFVLSSVCARAFCMSVMTRWAAHLLTRDLEIFLCDARHALTACAARRGGARKAPMHLVGAAEIRETWYRSHQRPSMGRLGSLRLLRSDRAPAGRPERPTPWPEFVEPIRAVAGGVGQNSGNLVPESTRHPVSARGCEPASASCSPTRFRSPCHVATSGTTGLSGVSWVIPHDCASGNLNTS